MRQQRTQLRFTQGLLDAADGELVIERAARQELETQLRAAQAEGRPCARPAGVL